MVTSDTGLTRMLQLQKIADAGLAFFQAFWHSGIYC